MRISDWSSDVCSSDLGKRGLIEREKVRFPSYLRRQYPSRSVHGEADMGDALLTGCTGTCGIATIFFEMCQYQSLPRRSEEQTSELQSLMRIPYADYCLTKKTN